MVSDRENIFYFILKPNFKPIFKDFIYNLDIIKELEERIRDNCSNNEAQNKKFGLLQVELSDEKVKNKQLEDRLEKIENEFENCKKELNTNQRLHSSLVRFQTISFVNNRNRMDSISAVHGYLV